MYTPSVLWNSSTIKNCGYLYECTALSIGVRKFITHLECDSSKEWFSFVTTNRRTYKFVCNKFSLTKLHMKIMTTNMFQSHDDLIHFSSSLHRKKTHTKVFGLSCGSFFFLVFKLNKFEQNCRCKLNRKSRIEIRTTFLFAGGLLMIRTDFKHFLKI